MSAMKTDVMERLGSVGNQVTLTTGATSALIGWFTTEHVLSMIGVICAAISLIVTWHYKRVAARRLAVEAAQRAERHALDVEERKARIRICQVRAQLLSAKGSCQGSLCAWSSSTRCPSTSWPGPWPPSPGPRCAGCRTRRRTRECGPTSACTCRSR